MVLLVGLLGLLLALCRRVRAATAEVLEPCEGAELLQRVVHTGLGVGKGQLALQLLLLQLLLLLLVVERRLPRRGPRAGPARATATSSAAHAQLLTTRRRR